MSEQVTEERVYKQQGKRMVRRGGDVGEKSDWGEELSGVTVR